jgi:protein-disulfide isomerase
MLALGVGLGYLFWGRASNTDTQKIVAAVKATQKALNPPPQNIKRYDVPIENQPALGPANAPITIVEFSDYECPYCRKWAQEVYHPLLEAYPNQIRFVYRDFPLTSLHANAMPSAEAADCANEQGKYWEFHEKLFNGQLGKEAYQQYATELGLDIAKFNDCVNSNRYQDEVMSDYTWAANLGVESTPTFFVNGIPIVGAQPLEVFTQLIDWELAGELPK